MTVLEVPFFNVWIPRCQREFRHDSLYFDKDRYSEVPLSLELMLPVAALRRNQFFDNLFEEADYFGLVWLTR